MLVYKNPALKHISTRFVFVPSIDRVGDDDLSFGKEWDEDIYILETEPRLSLKERKAVAQERKLYSEF